MINYSTNLAQIKWTIISKQLHFKEEIQDEPGELIVVFNEQLNWIFFE